MGATKHRRKFLWEEIHVMPSLCVLVLDPHLEYKFFKVSDHLSLHFLDIATEAEKIIPFIWTEIFYVCALTQGHYLIGIHHGWMSA